MQQGIFFERIFFRDSKGVRDKEKEQFICLRLKFRVSSFSGTREVHFLIYHLL